MSTATPIVTGVAGRATVRRRRRCVVMICGVALGLAAVTGCAATSTADDSTYGGLPTFLPTAAIQPDSVLTGTADRPALTTEGDSVEVQLAQGVSVRATVSGPEVPGEGLPYQTAATTCTWTVTLTGASASVPISVADFSTIDHLGKVYHPTLVPSGGQPPAEVKPGQTITFQLRAVMITGEGLMRWAPKDPRFAASWDFEVETD